MKYVDVVALTQEAIAEAMGAEYMEKTGKLGAMDSYKLADVGRDIENSSSSDKFVKALVSQVGKIVVDSDEYKSELPSIFVDSFDWGGYVERVYFSPADIIQDSMYNLVDGQSYDDHVFYQPKVSSKIFSEAKSITTPISIGTDQLKEAFTSSAQLSSFVSGIHTMVKNTIELAMEAYAHMLVSCGIAISTATTGDNALNNARHFVTEAVALGVLESGSTAKDALGSKAFLSYFSKEVTNIRSNMRRYTTAFNNGAIPTFTKESRCKMALLSQMEAALKFDLNANTFNKDDLAIGDYDTIAAWQAFKADNKPNFDFSTVSSVMLTADNNAKLGIGTDAITVNNVVGIIYDNRAMGLCPHHSKVTSSYTASADFWNEFHHQFVNYILDSNYNMVALCLD